MLFVDYIAEHLTPHGRAGVIVPEGIIFQSQTAHRQLRKMLVEDYLVAVISLPAGVFNPYSGVKTSILILDKALARHSDTIGFFNIRSDGFKLGAQRRPIPTNDLPQVVTEVAEYLSGIRARESAGNFHPALGVIAPKEQVAANGSYNLSAERYRTVTQPASTFPRVRLGDLLKLEFGTRITKRDNEGTLYPVYGGGGESFRTDTFTREDDVVISRFAMSPACVRVVAGKFFLLDSGFTFSIADKYSEKVTKPFVTRVLLSSQERIYECARGHAQKNIDLGAFKAIEIPLPPLETQKEIVAEIEGYEKVIDGAQAVLRNYRPTIPIDPDWPIEQFGHVTTTVAPPKKIQKADYQQLGRYPVIDQSQAPVAGRTNDKTALVDPVEGVVVFGDHTCVVKFVDELFAQGADGIKIIQAGERLLPKFLYFYLLGRPIAQDGYKRHFGKLAESKIPTPPIGVQQRIVAEIEADEALVNANRELIARLEKRIEDTLARVLGDAVGKSTPTPAAVA